LGTGAAAARIRAVLAEDSVLTENPLGGHAALAYGYSIPDQFVMARNSWGKNSGQQGNFTLPFAYFNSARTFLSARAYYL
jgi:C1A family cysteine protease